MSLHLEFEEIEAALCFNLSMEKADHLMVCNSCQVSVQWKRLARNAELWNEEWDWAAKAMMSLVEKIKQNRRGFVYLTDGHFSSLSMLPFQASRIIKISGPPSAVQLQTARTDAVTQPCGCGPSTVICPH